VRADCEIGYDCECSIHSFSRFTGGGWRLSVRSDLLALQWRRSFASRMPCRDRDQANCAQNYFGPLLVPKILGRVLPGAQQLPKADRPVLGCGSHVRAYFLAPSIGTLRQVGGRRPLLPDPAPGQLLQGRPLTTPGFNAQYMTRMARIALMPPKAMRCRPSETL
jgi:hypothetical protein